MKAYKLTIFDHEGTEVNTSEIDAEVSKSLKELISGADFLVSNYGSMWPIDQVKEVGDGHRGPTVEFTDGTMTWWYNIRGAYKESDF